MSGSFTGVQLDPRVAPATLAGVIGEQVGEGRVDQAGVARAGAVVDQAGDDLDAELAQTLEPPVVPGEVELGSELSGATVSHTIG